MVTLGLGLGIDEGDILGEWDIGLTGAMKGALSKKVFMSSLDRGGSNCLIGDGAANVVIGGADDVSEGRDSSSWTGDSANMSAGDLLTATERSNF